MPGIEPAGERYRPDIDGLRAVAVVPVVLFHVGLRGFSGGFVGVDIFFVISGYLITRILLRDAGSGRISIATFYRRRALRILPALFVMLLVVSVAARAVMLPEEMKDFARSLAATALFSSNVFLYTTTDYFNAAASTKPLLHTWSLAVEEQWYLIWPLLVTLTAARAGRLLSVALAIGLLSLGVAIWQVQADPQAAFFLLPARAWELGVGALLAIRRLPTLPRLPTELLGALGLVLILGAVKVYDHETAFPGIAAVPPCLGAALLIWSGDRGTLTSRILSFAPIRFVGLISYSLYLWHWPVIVLGELAWFLQPTLPVMAGQVLLSTALATLSWKFVELPFRRGSAGWTTPRILSGSALSVGVLCGVAVALASIGGSDRRLTPVQAEIAGFLEMDGDGLYRRNLCFAVGPRGNFDFERCLATNGKPAVLLIGDSHAAHLWPGLAALAGQYDILQATATGCAPKLYPDESGVFCQKLFNRVLREWLPNHALAATLFAARWDWRNMRGLAETLADPAIRAGHPILIGPVPQYAAALPRLLVAAERDEDPDLPARMLDGNVFAIDSALRAIARETSTPYVSMLDALCVGRECQQLAAPGVPMQFDYGHFTPSGSVVAVSRILPKIAEVAN